MDVYKYYKRKNLMIFSCWIVIAIVVSRANNTQAGTGILLAIGIVFILAGFFGLNGGMWNF